ncbi:MAG: Stealth CR1 domain-containing protein [candidate division NC10 bacterium]|nr:Stealth CR1 domain-containing protein [candidate division NC10 bacterium]
MLNDIDLVYLWVDSTDPVWQAKKIEALQAIGGHTPTPFAARFRNHDELKYSLRSVAKHAPFIRNIYLITNQQRPTWLNSEAGGLCVVDHQDIFPDSSCLPCFSSNAIETVMHRIRGLSEFFLYANDDMFFLNDVSTEDFLLGNAKMRVGFKTNLVHIPRDPEHDPFSEQMVNSCHLMEVELGKFYRPRIHLKHWIRLQPFRKNFYRWNYPNHQIQIHSKSIAYEIHDRFPREVSIAMHERFRSRQSVDVAALLLYYAIYRSAAMPIFDKNWLMMSKSNPGRLLRKSRALINTPPSQRPKFLCLNDCEYNEHFDWGSYITHMMESLFPNPSRFEKTSAENRDLHTLEAIVRGKPL